MSCYILRRGVSGTYYSVNQSNTNARPAVVAFQTKRQAGTYKRLINEIELQSSPHRRLKQNEVKIENVNLDFVVRTCTHSAMDVLYYSESNQIIQYLAQDSASDDIRFSLEVRYRYGISN